MYISANVSTFLIAALELGNLFVTDIDKCLSNESYLSIWLEYLLFQLVNVCL